MPCGALVVSALDQVAWLLNLRGGDVECNPVFFAYAVVTATGTSGEAKSGGGGECFLFIGRGDPKRATKKTKPKPPLLPPESPESPGNDPFGLVDGPFGWLPPEVRAQLADAMVALKPYASLAEELPNILAALHRPYEPARAPAATAAEEGEPGTLEASPNGGSVNSSVAAPASTSKLGVMVEKSSCAMAVADACRMVGPWVELVAVAVSPISAFKVGPHLRRSGRNHQSSPGRIWRLASSSDGSSSPD